MALSFLITFCPICPPLLPFTKAIRVDASSGLSCSDLALFCVVVVPSCLSIVALIGPVLEGCRNSSAEFVHTLSSPPVHSTLLGIMASNTDRYKLRIKVAKITHVPTDVKSVLVECTRVVNSKKVGKEQLRKKDLVSAPAELKTVDNITVGEWVANNLIADLVLHLKEKEDLSIIVKQVGSTSPISEILFDIVPFVIQTPSGNSAKYTVQLTSTSGIHVRLRTSSELIYPRWSCLLALTERASECIT